MKDVHSRSGSFDTVRLIAALMVFHSHSFPIAGIKDPPVPGDTWGGIAVSIFFVVSGYWVTQSAMHRSTSSFAIARALRIVPGLFICCLVTLLGCALATSLPVNAYLSHPQTWAFLWNALPFFHIPVPTLPGVLEGGPIPVAVNGSLWTLRYEVMCYVLLAIAALFGPRGIRVFMVAAGVIGLAALVQMFGVGAGPLNEHNIILLDFIQVGWAATFLATFAFGAWLFEADDRRLLMAIGASTFMLFLARNDAVMINIVWIFFFGSIAVWIGRHLPLDRYLTRGQDLSYGVYIYAFPCQQLAQRYFQPSDLSSFLAYYFTALAATVTLAALSWVLVERPALLLKNPLSRRAEALFNGLAARLPAAKGASTAAAE